MHVYLVPIGGREHELYCEAPEEPAGDQPPHAGVFRRAVHRFREMLAAAERERRERLAGRPPDVPPGWAGRMRARMMRWVAESIAEQRLLWNLRRCARAMLLYPDDIPATEAAALLRAHLVRDYEKHRRWLVLNGLGLIASAPLMFVPGPNVAAYYFSFRCVGHFFSIRGARHGLDRTEWDAQASGELRELREAIHAASAPERHGRFRDIQSRLGLEHLVPFLERVTGS